jgi:hypothetical protein
MHWHVVKLCDLKREFSHMEGMRVRRLQTDKELKDMLWEVLWGLISKVRYRWKGAARTIYQKPFSGRSKQASPI